MTKKEKVRRAKAAAASKLYRKRQKTKRLLQVAKKTLKPKPQTVKINIDKIGDMIDTAVTNVVDAAIDRALHHKQPPADLDRFHDEGGAIGNTTHSGYASALVKDLATILDSLRQVRNRQGDVLINATGRREGGEVAQPGKAQPDAAKPSLQTIISQQVIAIHSVAQDLAEQGGMFEAALS